MNISQAINQIIKENQVPYKEFLQVQMNIIRVKIKFKDFESMDKFSTAWAMSLRKKTNEGFVFFLQYWSNGDTQQEVRNYNARRAPQNFVNGQQRI